MSRIPTPPSVKARSIASGLRISPSTSSRQFFSSTNKRKSPTWPTVVEEDGANDLSLEEIAIGESLHSNPKLKEETKGELIDTFN